MGWGSGEPGEAIASAPHAERGTASVEFAAVLPLVAVCMLLVVQVALLVAEQLTITHAAREGARAAALWNDDEVARRAAVEAGALDESRLDVVVEPADRAVGQPVRVTLRYRPKLVVPFVGSFVPGDMELRASAQMRTEREASPS